MGAQIRRLSLILALLAAPILANTGYADRRAQSVCRPGILATVYQNLLARVQGVFAYSRSPAIEIPPTRETPIFASQSGTNEPTPPTEQRNSEPSLADIPRHWIPDFQALQGQQRQYPGQPFQLTVAPCTRSVPAGVVLEGVIVPQAGGFLDPYIIAPDYIGSGFVARRLQSPASDISYQIQPGETLPAARFRAFPFSLPGGGRMPEPERLALALRNRPSSSSQAPAPRVTYLGAGSMASSYLVHGEIPPLPPVLIEQVRAARARRDGDAANRIEQEWRLDHAQEVIKLLRPDPMERRSVAQDPASVTSMGYIRAYRQVRRLRALWEFFRNLAPRFRFRGQAGFIRMAEIYSSDVELSQGVIRQEVVRGPSAAQMQRAVDRLNPATRDNEYVMDHMTQEEAQRILNRCGLTWQEAQHRLNALSEFYRRTHADALNFMRENGLDPVANSVNSRVNTWVGGDLGNGGNVAYDPVRGQFVAFDI